MDVAAPPCPARKAFAAAISSARSRRDMTAKSNAITFRESAEALVDDRKGEGSLLLMGLSPQRPVGYPCESADGFSGERFPAVWTTLREGASALG